MKSGQKGVAICVKRDTFKSILDVTSSMSKDIVVVRVEMAHEALRIILGYAPQETENAEIREEFFTELEIEIAKCKMVDETPIVVGDMNAKISWNNNNIHAKSGNGKHLAELVGSQELDVLNFHNKCEGKWTHVIRTTNSASVLDYMLTPKMITNTMQQMIIDEECIVCPFSVKFGNKQYSDHNAIILRLMISFEKRTPAKQPKSWRITEDGIQQLIDLTIDTDGSFEFNVQGKNTQEMYDNFEKSMYQVMD